jgi:hypothetical protein
MFVRVVTINCISGMEEKMRQLGRNVLIPIRACSKSIILT